MELLQLPEGQCAVVVVGTVLQIVLDGLEELLQCLFVQFLFVQRQSWSVLPSSLYAMANLVGSCTLLYLFAFDKSRTDSSNWPNLRKHLPRSKIKLK